MKMQWLRSVTLFIVTVLSNEAWAATGPDVLHAAEPLKARKLRHSLGQIKPEEAKDAPDNEGGIQDIGDGVQEIGGKGQRQVQKDLTKTRARLNKMGGFDSAVTKDVDDIWHIYLHGLDFQKMYFRTLFGTFIPSVLWLIIYFGYFFVADRHRHHRQFVGSASRNSLGDLVFIFDHPHGPNAERDKKTGVDPNKFAGLVFKGNCEEFPRIHALMDRVADAKTPRTARSRNIDDEEMDDEIVDVPADVEEDDFATRMSKALMSERLQNVTGCHEKTVTLYEVKVALLQDCVDMFAHMGCALRAFSSIDKDEIYLTCSIADEGLINDFLVQNDAKIQLKADIVKSLGIKYPDDLDDSQQNLYDAPFARYDPKGLVKKLHECKIIEQPDATLVYKSNCHVKGVENKGAASFVGGSERFRIIYKRLVRLWDCDEAVNSGIMLQWFPLHNEGRVDKLVEKWGTFSRLGHFHFFQPLASIFHYFGARVTFMVAWNGSFAKALLGLAPIAIVVGILTQGRYVSANPMGIGFSLALVIWCRIATNLWRQEQHFLCEDWNQTDEGGIVLPTYRGEMRPSAVDLNMQEKYYSPVYATCWRCFSALVTGLFCSIVCITTYFWDFLFDGQVNITGSIVLAIQIKIFEFIWHLMALKLTECENYKYQRDWVDSFLWKKFIFYAVNSYYPFFYLTVIQGAAQARCPGNCIELLNMKLIQTMTILTLLRVVQVVMSTTILSLKLWLEAYQLRQSGIYKPGDEPEASYEERQAKAGTFKADTQVESMLQLILPLGFVLLFAPSAPFIVVLCLILFAVNIRSTGVMLTTSCQRPFPHRAASIGAWGQVMDLLMTMGLLANGFFLVQYGSTFKNTPVLTKCTGIMIFVCVCRFMWIIVEVWVPEHDHEVEMMVKRREHVLYKIAHLIPSKKDGAKFESKRMSEHSRSSVVGAEAKTHVDVVSLLESRWDDVELFPGAVAGGTPRVPPTAEAAEPEADPTVRGDNRMLSMP